MKAIKLLDYMMKSSSWVGFTIAMGWACLFKLCNVSLSCFIITGFCGVGMVLYYRVKIKGLGN